MSIALKNANEPTWFDISYEMTVEFVRRVQLTPSEVLRSLGLEVSTKTLKVLSDAIMDYQEQEIGYQPSWDEIRKLALDAESAEVYTFTATNAKVGTSAAKKTVKATPAKTKKAGKVTATKKATTTKATTKVGRARSGAATKAKATTKAAPAKTPAESSAPKVGRRNGSSQ